MHEKRGRTVEAKSPWTASDRGSRRRSAAQRWRVRVSAWARGMRGAWPAPPRITAAAAPRRRLRRHGCREPRCGWVGETGTTWAATGVRVDAGARPGEPASCTLNFRVPPVNEAGFCSTCLCRLRRAAAGSLGDRGPPRGAQALHHLHWRRLAGPCAAHDRRRRARVNSDKSSTYSTNVERRIIGGKADGRSRRAADAAPPRCSRPRRVRRRGSAGQRLDNFLLRLLKGVPKTHVYRVIRSGEVRVNKGRAAADTRRGGRRRGARAAGARGRAAGRAPPAPAREFPVLFEDEHLLAIDKPAGVAVHGGSGVSFGVIEQLRRARPQAQVPGTGAPARQGDLGRAAAGQEAQRADRAAGPVPRPRHRQDLRRAGARRLAGEPEGHRPGAAQVPGRRRRAPRARGAADARRRPALDHAGARWCSASPASRCST